MRLALLYLPIKSESFSVVLFKTCLKVRSLSSVFFPHTIKSSTMTSHFSMSSNISVMAISKTTGADQTRATGNLSNLNPPKGVLNVVSQIYFLRSTWSGRLLTLHQRLRKLSLLTYLRLHLPPSLRGNVNSLFTALFKSTGSRQIYGHLHLTFELQQLGWPPLGGLVNLGDNAHLFRRHSSAFFSCLLSCKGSALVY